MKALIFVLFMLASCGKETPPATPPDLGSDGAEEIGERTEACAGPHVGLWYGIDGLDAISIGEDCTYGYAKMNCSSGGVYAGAPTPGAVGTMLVTIAFTQGVGCTPAGTYTYGWALSSDSSMLVLEAGAAVYTYVKQ